MRAGIITDFSLDIGLCSAATPVSNVTTLIITTSDAARDEMLKVQ